MRNIVLLLGCLLTVLPSAQAETNTALSASLIHAKTDTALLPTEAARALLEEDPAVAAARAELDIAQQTSDILKASPYEWTPNATFQQRRVEHDDRYNEWQIGIDRTLRLPAKTAADRKAGSATIIEARAAYSFALQQAAHDLITLKMDWLANAHALRLVERNLQAIQKNLTIVEKRYQAGDASKLDISLAQAELSEQRQAYNDAKMLTDIAWVQLSTRFPRIEQHIKPLETPQPLTGNLSEWSSHIIVTNNEIKVLEAQLNRLEAIAERARAEKMPDPTVGVFSASEQGGRDRIYGVNISIPLPGQTRNIRSLQALSEVNKLRQQVDLRKRQIKAEAINAVQRFLGAYKSMQIALEGAVAIRNNADQMQRAYTLGEADLQSLLLAQRQAVSAENNTLHAQVNALKAWYALLVDAQLIWKLDSN